MKISAVVNTLQGISNPNLGPATFTISPPSMTSVVYSDTLTYTVTYQDYSSISLSASDVTLNLTGTATYGNLTVTGTGDTRTITITQFTGIGSFTLDIAAGTAIGLTGVPAAAGSEGTSVSVANQNVTLVVSNPSQTTGDLTTIIGTYWDLTYGNYNSIVLTSGDISFNTSPAATIGFSISTPSPNVRRVTITSVSDFTTINNISVAPGTATGYANPAPAASNSTPVVIEYAHLVDGSDGNLVINNGQVIPITAGQVKRYNSVTINTGGTLQINGTGITELGVRNDMIINGSIVFQEDFVATPAIGASAFDGKEFGFNLEQQQGGAGGTGQTSLSAGGSGGGGSGGGTGGATGIGGGGGGQGSATSSGKPGGNGGTDGGNGQDASDAVIGVGGQGGSGGGTGAGGPGGGPNGGSGASGGGGGGGASVGSTASGGAGGGYRGKHGGRLHIYCEGQVQGTGAINLNGQVGFNGGSAAPGGGGGGGGGAGGNGGQVFLRHRTGFSGVSIQNALANGGTLGTSSAGSPGVNGRAGLAGVSEIMSFTDPSYNWIARNKNNTGISFTSTTFVNGKFFAFHSTGFLTSSDGITWTSNAISNTNILRVAYGNSTYVAVGSGNTNDRILTSPDGITWTPRTPSESGNLFSVAYGAGIFVAVNFNGTNKVMTSPDGITWTSRTTPSAVGVQDVIFANGLFVTAALGGTGGSVMTSPDGINWTLRSGANNITKLAYGNGLFVGTKFDTVGSEVTYVVTSPDGITWTQRTTPSGNWRAIAYGNGMFVANGAVSSAQRIMTSPDGITWTSRNVLLNKSWETVAYGSNKFIILASNYTYGLVTWNWPQ